MITATFWRRPVRCPLMTMAMTGIAALVGVCMADPVSAKSGRDAKREEPAQSRPAGPPVMAVISLARQRVTIYDTEGRIMRAPVSTGQTGYETPAGIYSILQKKAEHTSNLYDDASMPFMQRLTWSGIALHAGVLPGRPASHGCVRMPLGFAEQLFEVTKLGMRVIVMRDDIGPADISHPLLFKPAVGENKNETVGPSIVSLDADPRPVTPFQSLRNIAAAKSAEAEAASKRAEAARLSAATKYREAAQANKALRMAQGAKFRAEAQLREVDRQIEAAIEPAVAEAAQQAKTNALAKLAETQAQLEAVQATVQPALDAVAHLRQEALAAEAAKVSAEEQAKEAMRKMSPVSVFISRRTQRLYVRQAREPLFESPIAIADVDQPLGTYVFTALAYANEEADLRWNAVSLYSALPGARIGSKEKRRRGDDNDAEALKTDVGAASSALDRIAIPKEAIDRISEIVSPGSSLIISDEDVSRETGGGTEFVIIMSDEPQGGIKMRRRDPEARNRPERPFMRSPYGWGQSFW